MQKKLPILRENKEFESKYIRLTDAIEELERTLSETQKEQFNKKFPNFFTILLKYKNPPDIIISINKNKIRRKK